MKQLILMVLLHFIMAEDFTRSSKDGVLTPKLTMVAMVDGKAFFVDRTLSLRDRAGAVSYCASLGMRLAEITSLSQFMALDQAEVSEWPNGSTSWTAGVLAKGIQRYVWETTNSLASPELPFKLNSGEGCENALVFHKVLNASFITDSWPTSLWTGVLCETLTNDKQI